MLKAIEICRTKAAGMARATYGRKTRHDGPTKASLRAARRAEIDEGLEDWRCRR